MTIRALLCSILLTWSLPAKSIDVEVERPILFPEGPEYIGRWIGDSPIVNGHIFVIAPEYVDLGCGRYPYRLLDPIPSDERNDYVALEVLAPERECRPLNAERIIYVVRISRGAARIHMSRCPTFQSLAYFLEKSGRANCSGEFHYKRGLSKDD